MSDAPATKLADLFAALAAAQGKFQPIIRNRSVSVTSKRTGQTYKFSYAPLDELIAKTLPALAAAGLAVTQAVRDGRVVTRICHAGGAMIEGGETMIVSNDGDTQQERGSALTYARRYSYQTCLMLAAEDDDDGNAAAGNHVHAPAAPAPVAARPTPSPTPGAAPSATAPATPAPATPEAPAAPTAPSSGPLIVRGVAVERSRKESPVTASRPWVKVSIKIGNDWYATFDHKLHERLMSLAQNSTVELAYTTDAKGYRTIIELLAATPPEAPANPPADAAGGAQFDDDITF